MHIRIGQPVKINAPKSSFHEQRGAIAKGPFLDHKGRIASVQVEIDGERIWFAASAINPLPEETP
ncbi:MAG: hypothetical protein ACLFQ1_11755 [Halochromatium sp.]|uniref:hypothetical protein n=1 Tax=Halochromatium sp. TaxID=2049430 RepID=UPI003978C6D6